MSCSGQQSSLVATAIKLLTISSCYVLIATSLPSLTEFQYSRLFVPHPVIVKLIDKLSNAEICVAINICALYIINKSDLHVHVFYLDNGDIKSCDMKYWFSIFL